MTPRTLEDYHASQSRRKSSGGLTGTTIFQTAKADNSHISKLHEAMSKIGGGND